MRRRIARWALAALLALFTMAGAGAAARADVSVTALPTPTLGAGFPAYGADLAATPDGGIVRLLSDSGIQRIGPRGDSTTATLPGSTHPVGGTLTLLQDGSLAFLATVYDASYRSTTVYVRIGADSVRTRQIPLPSAMQDIYGGPTAIAPDGSLWQVQRCGNVLAHWGPGHSPTRVRVSGAGCGGSYVTASSVAFAFGPDGAVWADDLCDGRIARVSVLGRLRTWSVAASFACDAGDDELVQGHPKLVATADGGASFLQGRIDAHGRLRPSRETPPDAVTPAGASWTRGGQTLVWRSPNGRVRRFVAVPDGRRYVASALGPDGRLWYLRARIGDGLSAGLFNYDFVLGAVDAAGHDEQQSLADHGELQPRLVTTGSGSIWLAGGFASLRVDPGRAVLDGPHIRVVRAIARRSGTVWIELSCSSRRPGAMCAGTAALRAAASRRTLTRSPARFAIPAGMARAIPFALTAAALAAVRAGAGHALAVVHMAGGAGGVTYRLHLR